jgi:DNA-binding HxlR family transcriptional regulator
MHTWNTITKTSCVKLEKAAFILDVLDEEPTVPIVEHLRVNGSATFLDLTVFTGFDASTLEAQLEKLSAAGLVKQKNNFCKNRYYLDAYLLLKVYALAKKIGR